VLHVAQPGHWFGPVTGPGWLGLAQPMWAALDPAQKNKIKNKKNRKVKKVEKNKKCVCMNKNNVNLLVYSLMLESGIKISV
jgi:hypothetical protein